MSTDDTLITLAHEELAAILNEVTARGGCLRFQAHGRSMWPFVHSGDTLVVGSLGGSSPRVGDILLYRTPGGGVAAHRFIGRRGRMLHCRGDRLSAPLELVEPDAVLARVLVIERRGRRAPASLRLLPLVWIALRAGLRACRTLLARILSVLASGSGRRGQTEERGFPD